MGRAKGAWQSCALPTDELKELRFAIDELRSWLHADRDG